MGTYVQKNMQTGDVLEDTKRQMSWSNAGKSNIDLENAGSPERWVDEKGNLPPIPKKDLVKRIGGGIVKGAVSSADHKLAKMTIPQNESDIDNTNNESESIEPVPPEKVEEQKVDMKDLLNKVKEQTKKNKDNEKE